MAVRISDNQALYCESAVAPSMPFSAAILAVFAIVLLVPGVAIGYGLSRKLNEIAGMTGIPLAAIAVAFGWAVIILGTYLADMLRPLEEWRYGFTTAVTAVWVTLWQIRATCLEA